MKMKKLLFSFTKNVHLNYNDIIYQQRNGVEMDSPLEPVLVEICMMHLERVLIPKLIENMNPWKRCIGDTISIIKETSIAHTLRVLNNLHKNIEFK